MKTNSNSFLSAHQVDIVFMVMEQHKGMYDSKTVQPLLRIFKTPEKIDISIKVNIEAFLAYIGSVWLLMF